jgi:hypothetical protein
MHPGTVLAQSGQDGAGLGGWYVGIAIGVAVVIVVVIVVGTIIFLAARIAKQAQMATEALNAAEANTNALWQVNVTNRTALAILDGAQRAREAVKGL